MKFLFLTIWLLLTLFPASASFATELPKVKSFKDWCNERDSLSAETKKTVDYLLEGAGTKDCRLADIALNERTELLTSSPTPSDISDLRPISSLTNLRQLSFFSHKITDLTPLVNLKNLEALAIYSDRLTDISPLASLSNLTDLRLLGKSITDIRSLSSLTKLKSLAQ
jgi:internalin A